MSREMKQWVIRKVGSFSGLELETTTVPDVGENEVLVKLHAACLNYRDIMIVTGKYYWGNNEGVVPLSDGAGEVVDVGSKVTRFKKGRRVMPCFFQGFVGGPFTAMDASTSLGGPLDGVLREYASFNEQGLVEIPTHLSYEEAATLPCAAVTAWNSLYGLQILRAGDSILTQGTGGVSIFAVQLGVAAGAQVISTTSSAAKGDRLQKLGAHHVINYKDDQNWGETAKKLSVGGRGVDHVLEIGGPGTLGQSSKAAAFDALVSIIGNRSVEDPSSASSNWKPHAALHSTRRIMVGSRQQFEEMNRAIEVNKIRPVVDERVFAFEEVREALQHLNGQRHFGNVVIKIG